MIDYRELLRRDPAVAIAHAVSPIAALWREIVLLLGSTRDQRVARTLWVLRREIHRAVDSAIAAGAEEARLVASRSNRQP